ncbi:hypothetical protein RB195_021685 [Necator americanus]|uniref:Fibronectin type-III domain-containing protein n=1 Tax=Necator americanus TaxID=51031 RepID=A0ABR1ECF9_NECAM
MWPRTKRRRASGCVPDGITAGSIRAAQMNKKKNGTEKNDKGGNSLAYRNIGPGQVEVSWTYPNHILNSVVGSTILYTDRKELSPEQWEKVIINDSKNTTVRLNHLRQGARYSVQIIPRLFNGDSDYSSRALFEMKTDNRPFQYLFCFITELTN